MRKDNYKFDPFSFMDDDDLFYTNTEDDLKEIKKRISDFSTDSFSESSRSFDDLFDDSHFSKNDTTIFKDIDDEISYQQSSNVVFNNPFDNLSNDKKDDYNDNENTINLSQLKISKPKKTSKQKVVNRAIEEKNENINKAKYKINQEFSIENTELKNEIKINKESAEFFTNEQMSVSKVRQIVESLLYVMGKDGLELFIIEKITKVPTNILKHLLDKMIELKRNDDTSGLIIKQYGSKYYMLCKSEMVKEISHIWDKTIVKTPNKLKMQVLSIIAYNSPCTKRGIESIRGKDCTNILKSLIEDGLIDRTKKPSRHSNAYFYTVTQKFLNLFNLKDLKDLPNLNQKTNKYISNHDFTIDDE